MHLLSLVSIAEAMALHPYSVVGHRVPLYTAPIRPTGGYEEIRGILEEGTQGIA